MYKLCRAAFVVLLCGCAAQPDAPSPRMPPRETAPASVPQDIEGLLRAARLSASPDAESYQLRAAALALTQNSLDLAANIVAGIEPSPLSDALRQSYVAIQAEIQLRRGQPRAALTWLTSDEATALPSSPELQTTFGEMKATANYDLRRFMASARERILMDRLLSGDKRSSNQDRIWQTLQRVPARTLESAANRAMSNDVRGWFSLAAMILANRYDLAKQQSEFRRWQMAWAGHPAAQQPPGSLRLLDRMVRDRPAVVAMLLPLEGPLALYGRAVRDGFLAARYEAGSRAQEVPKILVLDSSGGNISKLYRQARDAGAEFVVGPLDKERVVELMRIEDLDVPTLALNRAPEGVVARPRFYQFSLAPEDEVVQIATQAHREGHRRALVLIPDNEWGMRNYDAFAVAWETLGGTIADARSFATQRDYSDLIQALLGVDKSLERAAELRRIIGERVEFNARRRQDIDFVMLLANPAQAKGINPTLAFFFADDLPVYATSHVYDDASTTIELMDLNGIRFCDIPWKLAPEDSLRDDIQRLIANAKGSLSSFFALGVDAFRLYPRAAQLDQLPDDSLLGATGILKLNANNVVTRELMWAQIKEGEVRSMPLVTDSDT